MVNSKNATGNGIVAQNLRQALEEEGMKPAHLAAEAGLSRGYISKLLKSTKVNLSLESAQKIAGVLRRDVDWILGRETNTPRRRPGLESQETLAHDVSQVSKTVATGGASQKNNWRKFRVVPIVSFAQAGQAIDFELLPLEDREVVPSLCTDPKAFALILRGVSMEPLYSEGDVIIVSPSKEMHFERLAVAQLSGVGVCFKLLNMPPQKGMVRLSSYNPAFPPMDRPEAEFDWIYPVHSVIKYQRV